jgi:hypothetical protein
MGGNDQQVILAYLTAWASTRRLVSKPFATIM